MSLANNYAGLLDDHKRKRGRPKGSKNKPKLSDYENNIEELQRNNRHQSSRPKASRKNARKSSEFFFTIHPKSGAKCYYQTEVTVDYTPYRESDAEKGSSIIPRLNNDNKPHIPGFIMDMDKSYYLRNEQRYKNDHEQKITDYTKAKNELYQPKPGKKHNYCCVCKHSYEDYLEHVLSSSHKKYYNLNEFAKLIKGVSMEYEEVCRQNMKNTDQIDFNNTTETYQDNNLINNEDDCQILPYDSSTLQQKCPINMDDKPLRNLQQQQYPQLRNTNNNMNSYVKHDSINAMAMNTNNNTGGSSSGNNNNNMQMSMMNPNYLHMNAQNSCLSLSTKTPSLNGHFQGQTSAFNTLNQSSQQQQHQQPYQQYYPFGQSNNRNNMNTHIESERPIPSKEPHLPAFQKFHSQPGNSSVNNSGSKLMILNNINGKRKGDLGGMYSENFDATRKSNYAGMSAEKLIDLTDEGIMGDPQRQGINTLSGLMSSGGGNRYTRQMSAQYVD